MKKKVSEGGLGLNRLLGSILHAMQSWFLNCCLSCVYVHYIRSKAARCEDHCLLLGAARSHKAINQLLTCMPLPWDCLSFC